MGLNLELSAMLDTVKGKVDSFAIHPGQPLVLLTVNGITQILSLGEDGGELYLDNEPATLSDIVTTLLTKKMNVTLYPILEFYGKSVKAEFETCQ
jgi:hypothetical protein